MAAKQLRPRPAVIIQDDGFSETLSIASCLLTSEPIEAPMLRLQVELSPENGLRAASRLMAAGQCMGRRLMLMCSA